MKPFHRTLFPLIAAALLVPYAATAEDTEIDVRVISKGAKFIGTSMGGARVVIEDALTGEILAQGKTAGSTGDTAKIMKQEAQHHAPVSTEDAAVYSAKLDLEEPRHVKVCAYGPLAQPQAAAAASVTQWLVPGKDVTGGDGLTLELPGFVVDVLAPPAHQKRAGGEVQVKANVTMMCGCPIEPGGLWDADSFEVAAIISRDGEKLREAPLEYAGETSQFETALNLDESGAYEITVYAYDPGNGNTGLDKTTLIVASP